VEKHQRSVVPTSFVSVCHIIILSEHSWSRNNLVLIIFLFNKLQHLKDTVLKERYQNIQLTPHNEININNQNSDYSESKISMLKNYLLHILQFGTPEERIKILAGVTSKFKLTERHLQII